MIQQRVLRTGDGSHQYSKRTKTKMRHKFDGNNNEVVFPELSKCIEDLKYYTDKFFYDFSWWKTGKLLYSIRKIAQFFIGNQIDYFVQLLCTTIICGFKIHLKIHITSVRWLFDINLQFTQEKFVIINSIQYVMN